MVDFLIKHPTLTIALVGSFIFTLIPQSSKKAKRFTEKYLISSGNFTIGSLGIASLVHNDWSHFAMNMIVSVPTILLSCSFYGESFCLIVMLTFMFLSSMSALITKNENCGFSGAAYMFLAMSCIYGKHIIGIIIFAVAVFQEIYTIIKNPSKDENTAIHIIGSIVGLVIALVMSH